MNTYKVENTVNFNGKLLLGGYLSQNFEKSVPELTKMIEDKPYDVFVRGGNLYRKNKHIHRTTFFNATNYGYMSKCESYFIEAHSYTNKTKASSYKSALQTIIDSMDSQMQTSQSPKITNKEEKISVVEKIFNKMISIFN